MDFNRIIGMPRAQSSALPVGAKKALEEEIKLQAESKPKKDSRKEAEKKVKKISSDQLEAFIDSDPSKKEVYEYFKAKIAMLNDAD